jgi:hypothetical protein
MCQVQHLTGGFSFLYELPHKTLVQLGTSLLSGPALAVQRLLFTHHTHARQSHLKPGSIRSSGGLVNTQVVVTI